MIRMGTLSVLSISVIVAPYMSLVGFATVRYKGTIADNSTAFKFLQNFRFVVFRYKAAYSYRNSLVLARSEKLCMIRMVTLSVLSMLVRVAPFMTLIGLATVRYKGTIADNSTASSSCRTFASCLPEISRLIFIEARWSWQGAWCSA